MLTKAQLKELEKRIRQRFIAFRRDTFGEGTLSEEDLRLLKEAGILRPSVRNFSGDSYTLGKIANTVRAKATSMTYEELMKEAMKKPTTQVENHAINWANEHAGEYIKGIEDDMLKDIRTTTIGETRNALRAIQDGVAESIKNRETVGQLKTKLYDMIDDKYRDWQRVAFTEMNNSIQNGLYASIREAHGPDQLVYKRPNPDACFVPGSKILTNRGNINIEDVVIGDMVLTHRFRWRRVTQLHCNQYNGEMRVINGVKATTNHPFLINMDWLCADSINTGDKIVKLRGILYSQDKITLFDQDSFLDSVPMLDNFRRVMPISSINLYSNLFRRDSNIDIKFVNCHFKYWREFFEFVKNEDLVCGGKIGSLLLALCFFAQRFWSVCQSSCFTSVLGKLKSLLCAHLGKLNFVRVGDRARNKISFQNFFDVCFTNFKRLRCFFNGVSYFIKRADRGIVGHCNPWHSDISFEIGRINDIKIERYCGNVYNLSIEEDESYVVGGMIVHNCKHCKRLHLEDDGVTPRIFKLSELEDSNIGKKAHEWVPTVGSVHPWCQCQLMVLPDGMGFVKDDLGNVELKMVTEKPKETKIENIKKSESEEEEEFYSY